MSDTDGKPTILIVDDTPTNIQLLAEVLRSDYQVKVAGGGKFALDVIARQGPPDLILLDVMMPDMNGIEVLRRLRDNEQMRNIPVILVSADATEETQLMGLSDGADDYLVKPVQPRILRVRVRNLLLRQQTEKALRASEERWHFALEGAGDGAWDWNLETGQVTFSRRYLEMLGHGEEVTWTCLDDWKRHVNPAELQTAMAALEAYLDGKLPAYHVEYRMQCADGRWKWLLARGKVVSRAADGRPLRLIGTHSDITERKEALVALQASEARYRSIFENANTGIASTDSSGRVASFNEAFRAMLGYDAETLGQMNFGDFTHPDDLVREAVFFREILERQREHYQIEKRYIASDGRILWVDISVSVIRDQNGDVSSFVGVIRDITDRKHAEDALRRSTERLNEAQRIAHLGAWELDLVTRQLVWSDEVFRIFEIDPARYEASYEVFMAVVHPEDRDRVHQVYTDSLKNQVPYEVTHRLLMKDGRIKWVHERCLSEFDAAGKPLRSRGMVQDITERKEIEDKVRQLAFYDPLTRLPNRRLLFDRISQAMAQSHRNGCYGAVIFLDLDNFKPLNDRHGHAAGDLLLIEAAERLRACVREMDTVARFGGDEFVVVINDLQGERAEATEEVGSIAEKIRSTLSAPYRLPIAQEGQDSTTIEHFSAASLGVMLFFGHDDSLDDILNHADAAMYQAKEAGRNLIRFYEPSG